MLNVIVTMYTFVDFIYTDDVAKGMIFAFKKAK
jgi:hypothetical protein